jgi:eukaryotic-like serine/threonine-protein kinase
VACPDDEILLAMLEGRLRGEALVEADRHLDGCESCRDVVSVLASGIVPRSRGETPTRVGRYAIGELLGAGATGSVHAAHDPELDRAVALKRLHAGGDATQRARLLREAQALARLAHPNVVTVFDVGIEHDEVYVAMELVRGASLRVWMSRPHPEAEILATLLAAGRGLAAAHAEGLVHRDFKPENVLVGDDARVKVVDFGLAHEDAGRLDESADVSLSTTLTATGALLGTPAYMAPEQIDHALRGARAPIDARADQFSFAVAVWEALEGSRPFSGASRLKELREAIDRGPPRARKAPRPIERALARALRPDPRERWPSMEALLAALTPRSRTWWIPAVAAGAMGLATVAAFGAREHALATRCEPSAHALEARRDREAEAAILPGIALELDRWAAAWTDRRVEICEATHVRHEQSEALLDARMTCLDHEADRFVAVTRALASEAGAASTPELLATLGDPARCVRDESSAPHDDAATREARAALERATLALARGEPTSALETLGDEDPERLHPALRIDRALVRAEASRTLGRYDEALALAQGALFVAEEHDAERVLVAWIEVLRVLGASGRYREADDLLAHADAARRRRTPSPADEEAFLRARANVRTGLGDLAGARADLDEVARAITERVGPRALELASIHASLGNLARLEARFDDALREHGAALARDRELLGPRHPRVARDLHNLGGILRAEGRLDEASARYVEALSISAEAFGEHHPETALTRNSLGLVAFARGDLARARALWEQALIDLEAAAHGDASLVHHNLALLELDEGHPERALVQIRAALAIDRERVGIDAKRVAAEDLVLARALSALERREEAREALLRTIESAERLGEIELRTEAEALLAGLTTVRETTMERERTAPRAEPPRTPVTTRPAEPTTPSEAELEPADAGTPAPTPVAPEPEPTPAPPTSAPDAATPVWHPAGSGAYGARVPWE